MALRYLRPLALSFLLVTVCACSTPEAAPTRAPTRISSTPTAAVTARPTAEPSFTALFESSSLTQEAEHPAATTEPTQTLTVTPLPTVTPSASLTPTIAATAKITVTTALKAKASATKAPTKAVTVKPSATKPPTRAATVKPTAKPATIAPTEAPAAEPTSAPAAALTLQIVSVTSPVKGGANATLRAKTIPGANCSITVHYKSGPAEAAGLGPKNADTQGNVSWIWKVGARTTAGTWSIVVTASKDGQTVTAETTFQVQ